ncbi:MAG: DUF7901 domain-containing protein [Planctomycetota bacterium]
MADPLDGQVLKFSQQPMIKTTLTDPTGETADYFGHDELSTAWGFVDTTGVPPTQYEGQFMADDFADRFKTPVVHVKWWGSYLREQIIQPVDKFLISFEADIPATDQTPSMPGEPLLNQVVKKVDPGPGIPLTPGSGTFTERRVLNADPAIGITESLYEYNAELHFNKNFFQRPDTVYWLKIVALVDVFGDQPIEERTQWGWHNRDYTIFDPLASVPPAVNPGEHRELIPLPDNNQSPIWHFQDNAFTGAVLVDLRGTGEPDMPDVLQDPFGPTHYLDNIDGPGPIAGANWPGIGAFSKDLAFELYTIPEPDAVMLLLGVGIAWVIRRRG